MNDSEPIKGFFGEYRFLSNFWYSPVQFLTVVFENVESAFQAAKNVQNFDLYLDWELFCHNQIIGLKPGEIKKLGRTFRLPDDWEANKRDLMASLVFDKFYRNKELRQSLIKTDHRYLEETNRWHDNYWGVCICDKCHVVTSCSETSSGLNNLGLILMKVREFWR